MKWVKLSEYAEEVGYADKSAISRELEECCNLEALPKSNKLLALHEDPDWQPRCAHRPVSGPTIAADGAGRVVGADDRGRALQTRDGAVRR